MLKKSQDGVPNWRTFSNGQREMERQSLGGQSPYGIVAQDSFIYPTNFKIMT